MKASKVGLKYVELVHKEKEKAKLVAQPTTTLHYLHDCARCYNPPKNGRTQDLSYIYLVKGLQTTVFEKTVSIQLVAR